LPVPAPRTTSGMRALAQAEAARITSASSRGDTTTSANFALSCSLSTGLYQK
jgi:hypothetical protein